MFLLRLFLILTWSNIVSSMTSLVDTKGNIQTIPGGEISSGIVTIITSPGIPSSFIDDDEDVVFSYNDNDDGMLLCRGATLSSSDELTSKCLALSGVVSDTIIIEGITAGDAEHGLKNSRHARTITALFRARIATTIDDDNTKQCIIFTVNEDDFQKDNIQQDINELFDAVMAEQDDNKKMDIEDMYDIQIVSISPSKASEVLSLAKESAKNLSTGSKQISTTLQTALRQVKDTGVASPLGLEPPHIANAFVTINNASAKHTRTARARIATWKNRVARGLLIDGFGKDATNLRKRILNGFDSDTLDAVGLPSVVSSYRMEVRSQIQHVIDTSIQQVFIGQITNLEKSTLKRFNNAMLKTINTNKAVETILDENTALLRKEALLFETVVEDLEVPLLGLTKEKVTREIITKLNDALDAFPDSPAAKLKRTEKVKQIVNKQKKPGQRSIDFGLDIVSMLRPDGFGSLQGYAMYALPGGNSITFGIHNDADDPQVIAQFGGVRPPLLRIQPKLRVDIEM